MNRNGKQMKQEATHLTGAQRCEIIAKLSKPNVLSKRCWGGSMKSMKALSRKSRTIRRTYYNEQRQCLMLLNWKCFLPLICWPIYRDKRLSLRVLKLYITLSSTSTTNNFALTFKWKLDKMYCLRHLNRMLTIYLTLNANRKKLTLSCGLSQFHGHGSWFVCEVALNKCFLTN